MHSLLSLLTLPMMPFWGDLGCGGDVDCAKCEDIGWCDPGYEDYFNPDATHGCQEGHWHGLMQGPSNSTCISAYGGDPIPRKVAIIRYGWGGFNLCDACSQKSWHDDATSGTAFFACLVASTRTQTSPLDTGGTTGNPNLGYDEWAGEGLGYTDGIVIRGRHANCGEFYVASGDAANDPIYAAYYAGSKTLPPMLGNVNIPSHPGQGYYQVSWPCIPPACEGPYIPWEGLSPQNYWCSCTQTRCSGSTGKLETGRTYQSSFTYDPDEIHCKGSGNAGPCEWHYRLACIWSGEYREGDPGDGWHETYRSSIPVVYDQWLQDCGNTNITMPWGGNLSESGDYWWHRVPGGDSYEYSETPWSNGVPFTEPNLSPTHLSERPLGKLVIPIDPGGVSCCHHSKYCWGTTLNVSNPTDLERQCCLALTFHDINRNDPQKCLFGITANYPEDEYATVYYRHSGGDWWRSSPVGCVRPWPSDFAIYPTVIEDGYGCYKTVYEVALSGRDMIYVSVEAGLMPIVRQLQFLGYAEFPAYAAGGDNPAHVSPHKITLDELKTITLYYDASVSGVYTTMGQPLADPNGYMPDFSETTVTIDDSGRSYDNCGNTPKDCGLEDVDYWELTFTPAHAVPSLYIHERQWVVDAYSSPPGMKVSADPPIVDDIVPEVAGNWWEMNDSANQPVQFEFQGAGGGTSAAAVALLGLTSNSFSVDGGTTIWEWGHPPDVTISGNAKGKAKMVAGVVVGITITDPGSGYTTAPTATFRGGTIATQGNDPQAIGNNDNFIVAKITVTDGGHDYGSPPQVSIVGGAAIINGLTSDSFTVTSGDTKYLSPPTVTISGGGGTGATAVAMLDADGHVYKIYITNPGRNYTYAPDLAFSDGTLDTDPDDGYPYSALPAATGNADNFTGVGGGATAIANIANGKVTDVQITNCGSCYTSVPVVQFAPYAGVGYYWREVDNNEVWTRRESVSFDVTNSQETLRDVKEAINNRFDDDFFFRAWGVNADDATNQLEMFMLQSLIENNSTDYQWAPVLENNLLLLTDMVDFNDGNGAQLVNAGTMEIHTPWRKGIIDLIYSDTAGSNSKTLEDLKDGDTIVLDDGTNPPTVFEFDDNGDTVSGRIPVNLLPTATAIMAELAGLINNASGLNIAAVASDPPDENCTLWISVGDEPTQVGSISMTKDWFSYNNETGEYTVRIDRCGEYGGKWYNDLFPIGVEIRQFASEPGGCHIKVFSPWDFCAAGGNPYTFCWPAGRHHPRLDTAECIISDPREVCGYKNGSKIKLVAHYANEDPWPDYNDQDYYNDAIGAADHEQVEPDEQPPGWNESMPARGLGDTIAKVTHWFGIEQCPACELRQAWINKAIPYGWRHG